MSFNRQSTSYLLLITPGSSFTFMQPCRGPQEAGQSGLIHCLVLWLPPGLAHGRNLQGEMEVWEVGEVREFVPSTLQLYPGCLLAESFY